MRAKKRQVFWMAMAICVSSRLWLGGVVSSQRDKSLARKIVQKVRACARLGALLVLTDGWPAYKDAFVRAFRSPVYTGKRGHPRQVSWPDFVLAQTVKWQEAGRMIGIRVCHLFGKKRWPTTLAMAAGLTADVWSVGDLLCYQVAPAPLVPPKRRGRPPGKTGAWEMKGGMASVTA